MFKIKQSAALAALHSRIREVFAVVDSVVLTYDTHQFKKSHQQQAVKVGLDSIGKQKAFYQKMIFSGEPQGSPISLETLLGPYYNIQQNTLYPLWKLVGEGSRARNDAHPYALYWLYSHGLSEGDRFNYGLVDALLDPPMGISINFFTNKASETEKNQQLKALVDQVLFELLYIIDGELTEPLEITQWSTDWSNYFDAGHEWWGSFCWSIHIPSKKEVVIIAASATD